MTKLPIVARCKKCGRGFVTAGAREPSRDPFYPQGTWPTKARPNVEICGGEIEYLDKPDTRNL